MDKTNTDSLRAVLVAEDDVLVRNLIEIVLRRAGYWVLSAADGEEALRISRQYSGEIDLLVSDIVMPRMDGVALAAAMRRERPTTKTLLISGETSLEIARGNATFDFLRKPFLPAQLSARLAEMLSRPVED